MSNNQQAHRLPRGGQILGAPVHCTLIAQQVLQECDDQLLDEAVKAGSSGLSDSLIRHPKQTLPRSVSGRRDRREHRPVDGHPLVCSA